MDTWKERLIISLLSAKFRAINTISKEKAASGSVDVLIYPMQSKSFPRYKGKNRYLRSKIKSADGIDTQIYDWQGEGETALLIHGWDSNSIRWAPMIDHLGTAQYRWIGLDGPYHGTSGGDQFNMLHYVNMIKAVMLKYKPKHIVAHSLGALALAYYLGSHDSSSLQNLIMISPLADLSWHIDRYHKMLSLPSATREEMDKYFERVFQMKFQEFNMKTLEDRLHCHVTILHGEDDASVPITDGEAVHRWIKGSDMIRVKGYKHAMQHKDIYEIVEKLLSRK